MGSELLIRSYNVGCGDCFYVCIPDEGDGFHMLIDCGSKESARSGVMERSIRHLADEVLPATGDGKKRLDLIVVTHRHEDHIKGFDPRFFHDIAIGHIWLPAAMNKDHPQAAQSVALHGLAETEMRRLAESGAALSPELQDLVGLYGIRNAGAVEALTETLPEKNGIETRYVHAGMRSDALGITIPDTVIHVLGPEEDVDFFYLGKELDDRLRGFQAGPAGATGRTAPQAAEELPTNITGADFRTLQSRLLSNALAFAVDDSSIQNNVSTVLLIEWKGKRLLFVGDAEWDEGFKPGRKNSAWNVMWEKRRDLLGAPIDFLKVGHHGSHNATPWNRHADDDHEVNQIFDAILPRPAEGHSPTARCLVSTKRKQYDTIPDAELLAELGKRSTGTKRYLSELKAADAAFDPHDGVFNYSVMKTYSKPPSPRQVGDHGFLDEPQPRRTDLESAARGASDLSGPAEFVDVLLEA